MAIPRRLFLLLTVLVASATVASGCARAESGVPRRFSTVSDAIDWPASAPTEDFAVGQRRLELQRGARPLPTLIWYPSSPGQPGAVAKGRFPLVLLSHGLGGQPEGFGDLAQALATAGFVVIAPAYPFTKKGSAAFDRNDVRNQPADAAHVLNEVAKLGRRMDDPFAGRLASSRMAAAGFSAGGFTTSGLFSQGRDERLRCAVIISAGAADGGFTGPPAPVLFLHGDDDTVVRFPRGRGAYDKLTWPKAFMTMKGQGHGEFLDGKRPGFPPARAAITDFLRWNLYGDKAARDRLPADGTLAKVSVFEDHL